MSVPKLHAPRSAGSPHRRGMIALFAILSLFVGLAAAAPPPRSRPADAQVSRYLNAKFSRHLAVAAVHAAVTPSRLILTGSVRDLRSELQAQHWAQKVAAGRRLVNRVAVNAPYVSDAVLRAKIAQRLIYSRLDWGQIFNFFAVHVHHGVVTVSGSAWDPNSRWAALNIVENTKGVRGLVDHIRLQSLIGNDVRFDAARAIYRNAVLARYAMNPAHTIRIVVNDDRVTLHGVVESAMDRQLAYIAIARLPGIFAVKNDLVVAAQHGHSAVGAGIFAEG